MSQGVAYCGENTHLFGNQKCQKVCLVGVIKEIHGKQRHSRGEMGFSYTGGKLSFSFIPFFPFPVETSRDPPFPNPVGMPRFPVCPVNGCDQATSSDFMDLPRPWVPWTQPCLPFSSHCWTPRAPLSHDSMKQSGLILSLSMDFISLNIFLLICGQRPLFPPCFMDMTGPRFPFILWTLSCCLPPQRVPAISLIP